MNKEDIIRMTLEVGLPHWYHTDGIVNEERVIAFAALVASAAQAKEREACAKWLEDVVDAPNWAEAIRARGQS